jgi:hypothetical protein
MSLISKSRQRKSYSNLVAKGVNNPDSPVTKSRELGTVSNVEKFVAGVIDDVVCTQLQLD